VKRLLKKIRSNYVIDVLVTLKGNPRACIWTEPLWGIPYNLYLPYVTLFMTTLGLSYAEVGYVASITLVSEVVFSILSGVLTDKLGRRRCTVIFDTLGWSVPEFLWMVSQDFSWFVVAALFNGMWRVTENSWYLLMIEDANRDDSIALNSLTQLLGLIAVFFAPLSKFAVDAFGIVPTMRVLYGIAGVSMTAKFLILYAFSTETQNGARRMAATRDKSVIRMLWECKDVYLRIIREKRMLLTLAIQAVYMLTTTLNGNYWALYLRDMLGVFDGDIALFVTLKSLATLAFSFVLVPKLNYRAIRVPMLTSLAVFAVSQAMLLGAGGPLRIPLLAVSVVLEAVAVSVLKPVTNTMLFVNAEEDERARIIGMMFATVALTVALFPSLIGLLAQFSIRAPFVINLALFGALAVLTVLISRLPDPEK